jgi:hypothetical protein
MDRHTGDAEVVDTVGAGGTDLLPATEVLPMRTQRSSSSSGIRGIGWAG